MSIKESGDRLADPRRGVNTVGNGNKTNNNTGVVNGVLIQGIGGGSGRDGVVPAIGGRGGSSSSLVQNATNNLGNTNAQGAQGGGKKGSSPNQNSTQSFISP